MENSPLETQKLEGEKPSELSIPPLLSAEHLQEVLQWQPGLYPQPQCQQSTPVLV